jgi:hypothetical protein
MVKVEKVGVWKVDGSFFENADEATKAARAIVIREVLQSAKANEYQDEAAMFADLWDEIERKTTAAMAGA